MVYGKTIELYLVNGSADSFTTAELSNWNGKALKIPRIEVASCDSDDLIQPGVYFLFCKEDDGSDSVYIGEAENVKERLLQHLRDSQSEKEKYYWNTAVVFVGRDLNKAHIRYLENRFVEIARKCKRYTVLTKKTYNTVLKDSQRDVMEEFIDNVKVLINALGYNVLKPIPSKPAPEKSVSETKDDEIAYLHLERTIKKVGKVEADGSQTSEGFVVFQGSQISPEDDDTIPAVIKQRRKSASIDENGVLQEDMLFTSPSYAAMFVIGKSANGLTSWKTVEGKTLKSLENED